MLTAQTLEEMTDLQVNSVPIKLPAVTRPILRPGGVPPYAKYADTLHEYGFLVITLEQPDAGEMLEDIVGHIGEPHVHDDTGIAVWDIKRGGASGSEALARSHGLNEFVLHTDCSYEDVIPDHFGLYVVQADRFGGGKNLLIDGLTLVQHLSDESLKTLQTKPFKIKVPPEFMKDRSHIEACLIDDDLNLRYRREIVELNGTSLAQMKALTEFEELAHSTLVNRSMKLEQGQILLLNNRRFLHARTEIKDSERHLKRIRFFIHHPLAHVEDASPRSRTWASTF